VFGEKLDQRMELGEPFDLNVLLESHLKDEGFHSRETPRDWLHDGGHDGWHFWTTVCVRLGHSGHSTRIWALSGVLFCTLSSSFGVAVLNFASPFHLTPSHHATLRGRITFDVGPRERHTDIGGIGSSLCGSGRIR